MPKFKLEIPVGPFAPDSKERDNNALEDANNLLPVFGSYRTIPKLRAISSVPSAYPITGSLAHLVTSSAAVQVIRPDNWFIASDAGSEVGLWTKSDLQKETWQLLETVDDRDKFTARGTVNQNPGALSASLLPIQDPGVDDGFIVQVRYRLIAPDSQDISPGFEIVLGLYDQDNTTSYALTSILGPDHHGQDGFGTVVVPIAPGVIQAIRTNGHFGDLALQATPSYTISAGAQPNKVKPLIETFSDGPWEMYDTDSGQTFIEVLAQDDDPTATEENHILVAETVNEVKYNVQLDEISYKLGVAGDYELNAWVAKVDAGQEDLDVTVALHKPDGTEVGKTEFVGISSLTPVKQAAGFQQSEWDEIDDGVALEARISAKVTGGGGGASLAKYAVDKNVNNIDFLTTSGCPANAGWQCVAQTQVDEAEYVYEDTPATGAFAYTFGFPALPVGVDPATIKAYAHVRADVDVGKVEVNLQDGTNSAPAKRNTLFAPAETVVVNGNDSLDINNLQIRIRRLNNSSATPWALTIFSVWLEYETSDPTGVRLYRINLTEPVSAGIEFSHMRIEAPIPGDINPGDEPRVYVGTEESIYDVSEAGFIDVSKDSDRSYNQSPPYPRPPGSWVFASWGDRVVATDGANPIQYQDGFGQRFEDLLDNGATGTEEPLARYLAVVKDQLVLGNLYLANDPTNFNEYTIWYSKINNPRVFLKLDLTGQSDFQQLVASPGEITWIVGGEFGTIYKRNSIYRMNYIGPPYLYELPMVADNEGTAFGRSVVKVGDDQFFFGGGGFRVLPFGGKPIPIGDGVVTRMFIDAVYEDRAMAQIYSTDRRESEAAVFGRFDPWSGCIYWVYRRLQDNAYMNIFGIIYNPKEDRWAPMTMNRSLCELTVLPNFPQRYPGLMRSIIGYHWSETTDPSAQTPAQRTLTTENFSAVETLAALVETKVLSTKFFAGDEAVGRNGVIHGFRPKATIEPAVEKELPDDPVEYLIRIQGAEDTAFRCRHVDTEWIQYVKNANKDGWLMLGNPISGEYFKIHMVIPELRADSVRDIEGYEVEIEVGDED